MKNDSSNEWENSQSNSRNFIIESDVICPRFAKDVKFFHQSTTARCLAMHLFVGRSEDILRHFVHVECFQCLSNKCITIIHGAWSFVSSNLRSMTVRTGKGRGIARRERTGSSPTRTSKQPLRGFSGLIETSSAGFASFNAFSSFTARVLNAFHDLQASMITF